MDETAEGLLRWRWRAAGRPALPPCPTLCLPLEGVCPSPNPLQEVPPFGIREPRPTYSDGSERQDVLVVGGGFGWETAGWSRRCG